MIAKHNRRGQGFTLVELLLVIAVIGLLAARSLPAIMRAKAKAQRILCVGNLRQLGLAFHSFALNPGNRFPMSLALPFPGETHSYSTPRQPAIEYAVQSAITTTRASGSAATRASTSQSNSVLESDSVPHMLLALIRDIVAAFYGSLALLLVGLMGWLVWRRRREREALRRIRSLQDFG